MVQDSEIEQLLSAAERAQLSLDSLSELLHVANVSSEQVGEDQVGNGEEGAFDAAKKNFLLGSFAVKTFHRKYKEWENEKREQFVEGEVKQYNRMLAQMSRMQSTIEDHELAYSELRQTTKLPKFHFSIQTVKQYDNGRFLAHVAKDDGKYPLKVDIEDIFSVDPESRLATPSYEDFKLLVNIEYRLRMLKQIKYEVLLRIKTHLTAKNNQWASRDTYLNLFIMRDLPKVFQEVEKIKASEYEDLKYYEEDYEMHDAEEEDLDEQEEAQPEPQQTEQTEQLEEEQVEQRAEPKEPLVPSETDEPHIPKDQPVELPEGVEPTDPALNIEASATPEVEARDEMEATGEEIRDEVKADEVEATAEVEAGGESDDMLLDE